MLCIWQVVFHTVNQNGHYMYLWGSAIEHIETPMKTSGTRTTMLTAWPASNQITACDLQSALLLAWYTACRATRP